MGWETLIPLITQYGIPWTYSLWKIITTHSDPTEEAWAKLIVLSQTPELDYLNAARAKVGLPPIASYDPRVNPVPTVPVPPA